MDKKEINLYSAFANFLAEMRTFIPNKLNDIYQDDSWLKIYRESLMPDQMRQWDENLINLEDLEDLSYLIDYGNLKSFVLKQKDFLRHFFTRRDVNNLPTMFNQMSEARNNLMHFLPFNKDEAQLAYLQMTLVAKMLRNNELKNNLERLYEDSFGVQQQTPEPPSRTNSKNSNSERLYTNKEIQEKITEKAKTLPEHDLIKLCDKEYSHEKFNNTYAIFVRVPQNASKEEKQKAIKDHNDRNRWTVKYEFSKHGYSYFITTIWYPRNDEYVRKWLNG
jgi:hypothetical protein